MYSTGDFPKDEKQKQTCIYFVGKSDGNNFHLIALTSCSCKLFELIIQNKL